MISVQGGILPPAARFKDTTVPSFFLSKTETTWSEWNAVLPYAEAQGYDLKKMPPKALPDHPAQGVSWYDALKWCNAKSEMEGLTPCYTSGGSVYRTGNAIPGFDPGANGYRLPGGAEWEWAASGGASSLGYTYSGGNDLNKVAWNWNNSVGAAQDMSDGRGTWPVAIKEANELGFHDMSGNVAEWSGDVTNGPFRGTHGGAWFGVASDCAVNHVNFSNGNTGSSFIGFRTARGGALPANSASPALSFSSPGAIPAGKTGVPYNFEFTAQGGIPPVRFSVKKDTPLPPGLLLANGRISGSPTTSGTFAFTLTAEDSNPSLHATAEGNFTLEIASYGLEISFEPALISAKVQQPLEIPLSATGGASPYKWSAPDGLPRGLTLDTATGILKGVPIRPESLSLIVQVEDAKGFRTKRSIPASFSTDPLHIPNSHPPSAMVGVDFLWQIEAKGGLGPYKFELAPGTTLPPGMYLSAYKPPGRIIGSPQSTESHTVKIVVTDSLGQSADYEFTLPIVPYDLSISDIPAPIEAKYGEPIAKTLRASGGAPPVLWNASGNMPAGVTLNPEKGELQGTPTRAGSFEVVFKATDAKFKSTTKNATIRVAVDPVSITATTLPPAKQGVPYSAEIPTSGGVLPVGLSLKSGSVLPPGLSLEKGRILGTPSTAGIFSFTVVAEDSNAPARSQSEKSFSLEVSSYGMEIHPEPAAISGKVKESLSVPFTATGGQPPYKWSATGSLPRGLSLNQTSGILEGSPSTLGNHTLMIRLVDAAGIAVTRNAALTITADPLTIDHAGAQFTTMAGADLLWQIPVRGGLPPYKIAIAEGGTLPPGLYLSEYAPPGRIIGEPRSEGTFTFNVIAKDALGQQIEGNATITVTPYNLAIADIAPVEGKFNEPLKMTPSASGGVPPLVWSIQGKLPKGLTLDIRNGEISGSPLSVGTFDFAFKVTDGKNKSFSKNATIRTTADPLAITTQSLPAAKAGVPFHTEMTTTGGVPPVNLALKSGEHLPPGLALGKGAISGTPSAAGTFTFTISAGDANTPAPSRLEKTFTLEIASYGMEISSGPALISGKVKEPLSVEFQVSGGAPPYRWTASGDMPEGVSINPQTGALSGTPDELKSGTILIRVLDATGFPATRSVPLAITTDPLEIIAAEAPEARSGRDFKWPLQIKGGLSPRPIRLAPESTLPPGLYLSFNGSSARILGKPRSEGTFHFTLIAEETGSTPVRKDFVLTVLPSTPEITESPLPVEIATTSLPSASLEAPYNQTIESSGGVPPLKLALKSGSHLPPGLLLVKDRLSGTPTLAGNHTFTLTATDVQGSSAEATLQLVVSEKPMQIGGPRNAKGEEFKAFKAELRIKGGKPPHTWSLRAGLPAGLNLDASTGVLSGVPGKGTAGNHSVSVQVTDSESRTASGIFAFAIAAGDSLVISSKTLPTAILNTSYNARPATKGGDAKTLRWSIETGTLPTGLSLNATTGEISGTPTTAGTSDIVLKVEDSFGNTSIQLLPVTVGVDFKPGMVFVLGGKLPAASPLGEQSVADFYLSRYELTWGEWKQTRASAAARGYDIGESGSGTADDHPVQNISWYDAVKWCNLKSELDGLPPVYTFEGSPYKTGIQSPEANPQANGYRLPTEIEWEWAARGGISSKSSNFSGANELDPVAWHAGNSPSSSTHPVGAKQANELGLQDMSGNVQEWCWDPHKNYRRVRGGGFKDDSFACTITSSDFTIPDRPSQSIGFRPARNFKK